VLPNKPYLVRAFYEWIVASECTPYVVLDTTIPYVKVPTQHIQNDQIVLNTSPSAVRNFQVKDKYLTFKASFDGEVMEVYSPIKAIVAVYAKENGRGMVFDLNDGDDADHPLLEPQPHTDFLGLNDEDGDDDGGSGKSKGDASHLKIIK
jgi:stringent starvation protein B